MSQTKITADAIKQKPVTATSKKPPFRVGPHRSSSANANLVKYVNSKKTRFTTADRLRRSQSLEASNADISERTSTLKEVELMIGRAPVREADRQSPEHSHHGHEFHRTNKGSLSTVPKKRQPFSFSKSFQGNQESSRVGDGPNGSGYRSILNAKMEGSEDNKSTEARSPRVHFADPIHREESESYFVRLRDEEMDEPEKDDPSKEWQERQSHEERIYPFMTASEISDSLILAQTDDLIKEVTSLISNAKATSAPKRPRSLSLDWGANSSRTEKLHDEEQVPFEYMRDGDGDKAKNLDISTGSEDGITNVQCPPSVLMVESARSTFSPLREESAFSQQGIPHSGRPSSASLIRSVSNEDIHGRIAMTLQMIEQEELRSGSALRRLSSEIGKRFAEAANNMGSNSSDARSISSRTPDGEYRPSSAFSGYSSVSQQGSRHDAEEYEKTIRQQSQHSPRSSDIGIDQYPQRADKPEKIQYEIRAQCVVTSQEPVKVVPKSVNEKAQKIFSFLEEAEKTDRETLLGIQLQRTPVPSARNDSANAGFHENGHASISSRTANKSINNTGNNLSFLQKIDTLIRKGSIELAKEQIILERKLEESQQRIKVLEETLIHQRELNMRNLRNSERDLNKRLRLQKEEFDVAFARNEALINEMVAEKRVLQERCDKLMKQFDDMEERYKEQIKNLHQKHLDEIKRLRKAQVSAENLKKQQWIGNKAQEIKEMTVKGLEPEVQRLIQRHQQEMNEMRAWHSDELRETEERCQRRLQMQLQEMRERVAREAEEMTTREKEALIQRYESTLNQREEDFNNQRRKHLMELEEVRERVLQEETKLRESMQDSIRRAQVKGEVEVENLRKEYETKIANLELKHTNEIQSLKDIQETEVKSLTANFAKKQELALKEKSQEVEESLKSKFDRELKDREKKFKEDLDRVRMEEEAAAETRLKRLQEKFSTDLSEMDNSEKELKSKLSQTKAQLLQLEEEVYSLRTAVSMKDKLNTELQETNSKMLEERANLTSIIRREFTAQIDGLETEVRSMKASFVEIQTKHKLDLEQKQLELEKMCMEKDAEVDSIGVRVQQTIARKDETIQGLQQQMEKCNFQIEHLEGLLEEQRRNLVDSMTKCGGSKRK